MLPRPGVAAVVFTACGLAACGSSDSSTQANGARSAPAVSLAVTITVTSPFGLSSQATDTVGVMAAAPTCAEAAAGIDQDGHILVPPRPSEGTKLAGADGHEHALTFRLHVAGYHGPAAYPSSSVVGDGGDVLVVVDGMTYGTAKGGTATITVNGDGSGRLVLDKLTYAVPPATEAPSGAPAAPPATPPPGSVPPFSATVAWTCTQLRAPTPGTPPAAASPTP